MSALRAHLRSNVVNYLALFAVFGGGTAYGLAGHNTVRSDDIVNGQVKKGDIAGKAVNGAKVGNAAFQDGLTGADFANASLGGGDITNNELDGLQLGTLTGADVGPGEIGSGPLGGTLGSSDLAANAVPSDGSGADGSTKVADNAIKGNELCCLTGGEFPGSGVDASRLARGTLYAWGDRDRNTSGVIIDQTGSNYLALSSGTGKLNTTFFPHLAVVVAQAQLELRGQNQEVQCWLAKANPADTSYVQIGPTAYVDLKTFASGDDHQVVGLTGFEVESQFGDIDVVAHCKNSANSNAIFDRGRLTAYAFPGS